MALCGCSGSFVRKIDKGGESLISQYVAEFNASDDEIYIQRFPNSEAEEFLKESVPVFECPDKELEKTWYFRWWTFRKHIKSTPEGFVITEFLPDVPWAGKYNAICCPAAHHFNEGRWLKDPLFLKDYAAFWCREKEDARIDLSDLTCFSMNIHMQPEAKHDFSLHERTDARLIQDHVQLTTTDRAFGTLLQGNRDIQAQGCGGPPRRCKGGVG